MMQTKQRISHAFGRAVDYERHAALQLEAATRLDGMLADLVTPPPARILEIGCGTGLLTRQLRARWPQATVIATDLAPAMVNRCRERVPGVLGVAMDGEQPAVRGGFQLIAASMATQWFTAPERSLRQLSGLLAPQGGVALATLGEETFTEWRQLCATHHLPCATADYPSLERFATQLPAPGWRSLHEARIPVSHPSVQEFLLTLRGLGATTPLAATATATATPGALRRVLRPTPEAPSPFTVTYHLLFGVWSGTFTTCPPGASAPGSFRRCAEPGSE